MARRHFAVLVSVLALTIVAVILVHGTSPRESDEERIRKLIVEGARAAEERRPKDAVIPISSRFSGGSLDRDGVRRLIAFESLRGSWTSVTVTGLAVTVEGDRAKAAFDVVASRGGSGQSLRDLLPAEASAWRVECELERETEEFRIVRASWHEVSLVDVLTSP